MKEDLKNEIKLITLPDEKWKLWKEFLTKYPEGETIDPVSKKLFKELDDFSRKSLSLKREFFKHLGLLTDRDLEVMAQHLLYQTPNRVLWHPKVSVGKTKFLVRDHQTTADWAERRKRKRIVHEELMAIKPSLKFRDGNNDTDLTV